jgi:sugar transferase (PEP-CTERM/EpsH1 system associated)
VANLLYLVHRMPYPPNKGDKVRSYHLLKHLAARHRVFVGTFIDDPEDEQHLDALNALCAGVHAARLQPLRARLASLSALLTGEALTLRYYRDVGLGRWVEEQLQQQRIDAVVVFSSSMAQYALGLGATPVLVDFVDVDSAKWAAYAPRHRWPLSWLYRREGQRLLAFERHVAASVRHSYFSTEKECALFQQLAPECVDRVDPMCNGVDAHYFAPDPRRSSPYETDETPLVFTGAMDYWPNIDAVTWFTATVLPVLRRRRPGLRFHIVGRSPSAAVKALAGPGVVVTGTVPDVRPYLQHAAMVVAPLRLARGIQNKVLEAMAMGRPLVVAAACAEAIDAEPGRELLVATDENAFCERIEGLLDDSEYAHALGAAGRACVMRRYTWSAHLAKIDLQLEAQSALEVA